MWRAEEFIQDEARADYYQDRARMDAAMGNYGQAVIDEARSDINRVEAVVDISSPFGGNFGYQHHHHGRVEGEIIAAEFAAADINMMERERLRQMEMGGAYASYYPPAPGYGVPPGVSDGYPGVNPQQYPPPGGYPGYPGAGYPPY